MTFDYVIELVTVVETVNEYGSLDRTETAKEVYAGIKSTRKSEERQAQAIGLEPKIVFILAEPDEYQNQERINFNGKKYRIISQYLDMHFNILELTCADIIHDLNS